jgi:hypothetical protein
LTPEPLGLIVAIQVAMEEDMVASVCLWRGQLAALVT